VTYREERPKRWVAHLDPAISEMIQRSEPQADEDRERLLAVAAGGARVPRKRREAARSALVQGMIRYAAKVAFARRPRRLDPDEAFCEAMQGVVEAVHEWDPARGGVDAFKALVRLCCIRRLQKAKETADVIRIPRDLEGRIAAGRAADSTVEAARRARSVGRLGDVDPAGREPDEPESDAVQGIRRVVREGLASLRAAVEYDVRRKYGIEHQPMTAREIAALRGCTPQAVNDRLYRARKKLRGSLANLTVPERTG